MATWLELLRLRFRWESETKINYICCFKILITKYLITEIARKLAFIHCWEKHTEWTARKWTPSNYYIILPINFSWTTVLSSKHRISISVTKSLNKPASFVGKLCRSKHLNYNSSTFKFKELSFPLNFKNFSIIMK